jgi:hypothetical protein
VSTTDIPVTAWRKSGRSNGQANCVEVAALAEETHVFVRDSKDPSGPALTLSPRRWRSFTAAVKAGRVR